MTQGSGKDARGEMRRRHEAIVRSGVLARVRSEGRLVFGIALCWADYKTCQFRMSMRGAASMAGVHPNTVRRGITQLVAEGVIEVGPSERGKRQRYRFRVPQEGDDRSSPPRSRAVTPPRSPPVCAPVTPGVRPGHGGCAQGSRVVTGAHTGCDPYSSIVLKVPQGTLGGGSPDGLLPPRNENEIPQTQDRMQ